MAQPEHLFIDNIRFWAMAAVVATHTAGGIAGALHTTSSALVFATEDLLKFGTVGFFLVSGFLLGDRFATASRIHFLTRRLRRVFLPWLFWFTLQVAFFLYGQVHLHGKALAFDHASLTLIAHIAQSCLVATAFWFVPSLFLAIAVLAIFRPYLHDLRLGCLLLAVSLFYALNIYTLWIPTSHTIAPLGFVFFLWLGVQASRRPTELTTRLTRTPTPLLAATVLFAPIASLAETRLLTHLHSIDPTNSLRISNQLFSIAAILLLAKLRRRTWPAFINIRTEIFGVYLTLTFVLSLVETSTRHLLLHLPAKLPLQTGATFLALWLAASSLVAILCFVITRLLARHRYLAWIVGAQLNRVPGTTDELTPQPTRALPASRLVAR